jgi:hypothetical protein
MGIGFDRSHCLHILSWINSYRMVCNLGLSYPERDDRRVTSGWDESKAQKLVESMPAAGTAT